MYISYLFKEIVDETPTYEEGWLVDVNNKTWFTYFEESVHISIYFRQSSKSITCKWNVNMYIVRYKHYRCFIFGGMICSTKAVIKKIDSNPKFIRINILKLKLTKLIG